MKTVAVSRNRLLIGILLAGSIILLGAALIVSGNRAGAEPQSQTQVEPEAATKITNLIDEVAPIAHQVQNDPEAHAELLTTDYLQALQYLAGNREESDTSTIERRITGEPEIVNYEVSDDGTPFAEVQIPIELVNTETDEVEELTMLIFLELEGDEWRVKGIHNVEREGEE